MARMSLQGMEAYDLNTTTAVHKLLLFLILILFFLLAFVHDIAGRGNWVKNELKNPEPMIYVDYWSGKKVTEAVPVTDVYVEINPSDLVFLKSGEGFTARFRISVLVYEQSEDLIAERSVSDSVKVPYYEKTMSDYESRLCKLTFNLPVGRYRALVRIVDENVQKEAVYEKEMIIRDMTSAPVSVSDILLAGEVEFGGQDEAQQSVSSILPYPAAIYGKNQENLYCYFEVYPGKLSQNDSIKITLSYFADDKQQVILKEMWAKIDRNFIPVFYSFKTVDLPPGFYKINVQLRLNEGEFYLEHQKLFYVYQSPIDLRFKNYRQALAEIRLIADPEEVKELEKLPVSLRQQALREFWKKRDPTPDTKHNELMSEFYKRVSLARKLFWVGSKENGHFSDRGKVYILYGPPDNIYRRNHPRSRVRMEIWYYYQLSIQAVFMDEFGFGEYQLVQPYSMLAR